MGSLRSRSPIMPFAICLMTAALAYAAGKQSMGRKADGHSKAKAFKRRAAKTRSHA